MGRKVLEIDGKPVVDAKHPIRLHIKLNDIKHADRKEPADCVVARACRREMHAKEVRVHTSRLYVRTNEGNWVRYVVSPRLRQEIVVFDRGGRFQAENFRLYPPPPSKQRRKRQGTATNENSRNKKRREYITLKDVRTGPA